MEVAGPYKISGEAAYQTKRALQNPGGLTYVTSKELLQYKNYFLFYSAMNGSTLGYANLSVVKNDKIEVPVHL